MNRTVVPNCGGVPRARSCGHTGGPPGRPLPRDGSRCGSRPQTSPGWGYGRGRRMKIESDQAEVISGVRLGDTLGSPIALIIWNRDAENWQGGDVATASGPGRQPQGLALALPPSAWSCRPGGIAEVRPARTPGTSWSGPAPVRPLPVSPVVRCARNCSPTSGLRSGATSHRSGPWRRGCPMSCRRI